MFVYDLNVRMWENVIIFPDLKMKNINAENDFNETFLIFAKGI